MSAHTPGPWRVENGTYCYGYVVATVYCTERVPTEDGLGANHVTIVADRVQYENHEAMQSANARLIAAAPELLEALRFVFESPGNDINKEGYEKGYAAIAKATEAA